MSDAVRELLAAARQARNERRMDDALLGYSQAAELARDNHNPTLLAHALRHVSDIAREMGRAEMALAAGKEAVDLVRATPGSPHLDLANALRVTALAWQGLGKPAEAAPLWREARDLYTSADIPAGVKECEENLVNALGRG